MEELENMCRGCAVEIELEPDLSNFPTKSPFTLIKWCFPNLKICKSQKGDYKLCVECLATLQDCANFRLMVLETETHYEKFLSELQLVKAIPSDAVNVNSDTKVENVDPSAGTVSKTAALNLNRSKNNASISIKTVIETETKEKHTRKTLKSNLTGKNKNDVIPMEYIEVKIEDRGITNISGDLESELLENNTEEILNLSAAQNSSFILLPLKSHKDKMPKKMKRIKTPCMYCNTVFRSSRRLIHHEKSCVKCIESSVDGTPYSCLYCSKTYRFFRHLQNHEVLHTTKHVCAICSRRFGTGAQLRSHSLKHTRAQARQVTCPHCGRVFPRSNSAYQYHIYSHTKIKEHSCNICQKKFIHKANLQKHEKTHSTPTIQICERCGKTFEKRSALQYHRNICYGTVKKRTIKCEHCDKTFKTYDMRTRHTITAHEPEKMLQCKLCPKKCVLPRTLRNHMKTVHGGPKERNHACTICSRAFTNSFLLRRHMRVHTGERPHPCTFCDKEFARREYRIVHEEVHRMDEEKTIMCEVCSKTFYSSLALQFHERTIKGHRKYKNYYAGTTAAKEPPISLSCDICNTTYARRALYRTHLEQFHREKLFVCSCSKTFFSSGAVEQHERLHLKNVLYECDLCLKKFSQKYAMQNHRKMHTGEHRTFACKFCDRQFVASSSRDRHERIHTGEKPFACEYCEKAFKDSYTLRCHQVVHTGERPYSCKECNKSFTHPSTLSKHQKKFHTEK